MERETSRSVLSPAWMQAVGDEEGGREGGREGEEEEERRILERREGCGG